MIKENEKIIVIIIAMTMKVAAWLGMVEYRDMGAVGAVIGKTVTGRLLSRREFYFPADNILL